MTEEETDVSTGRLILRFLKMYWGQIFFVIYPLALLPIVLNEPDPQKNAKFRCFYVILLMCGYWITECIPAAITGMFPICFFPMLNILDSSAIVRNYFNEVTMMFIGSILVALAIEQCGLHTRIALIVIRRIGCDPKRLLIGFILTSSMFSAFMANSAVAAMMCPIAKAIILSLEKEGVGSYYKPQTIQEIREGATPKPTNMTIALFATIAYTSTTGGLLTVVGTGTTLAYKGLIEGTYKNADEHVVSFVYWFLYNTPNVVVIDIVMWCWFGVAYLGYLRPKSEDYKQTKIFTDNKNVVKQTLKTRYVELGPWTWHELWVLGVFITLVLFWLFRAPKIFPGIGDVLVLPYIKGKARGKFITNSVPCFIALIVLLFVPRDRKCCHTCSKDPEKRPKTNSLGLTEWKFLLENMSWGLMFMIGGGFCIAEAGIKSGMSAWLGNLIKNGIKNIDHFLILAILLFVVMIFTEFTSNSATCNVFIPAIFSMTNSLKVNPLIFSHPVAIACSHAYMFPVGTPPNAMIVGYTNMSTREMMKAGSVVKIISYLTCLMFPLIGRFFFDLQGYPDWAATYTLKNATSSNTTSKVLNCAIDKFS